MDCGGSRRRRRRTLFEQSLTVLAKISLEV